MDLPTLDGTLTVDLDITSKLTGAFKTSHKGRIDFNPPDAAPYFEDVTVCVKQLYSRTAGGALTRHTGRGEVEALFQECRCLDWANILLQLTYDFIEEALLERAAPTFDIPQLRVVRSMLAISNVVKEKAFLVEEWIDTSKDKFLKYINNGMPVSCVPPNAPKHIHERAEFLCFAQHVQWRKTGYKAFTSDYQGAFTVTHCITNADKIAKGPVTS